MDHRQRSAAAWLSAKLGRAKRIPPLRRLFRSDEARPLPPDEAERERKRHEDLARRVAPDATATEDQLKGFIERENREFAERKRVGGTSDPEEDHK